MLLLPKRLPQLFHCQSPPARQSAAARPHALKQQAAAEDAKKPARTSKGLATRTRSTCAHAIGCAGFHSCFEKPSSASAHPPRMAAAVCCLPPLRAASKSLFSSLSPALSSLCKNACSRSHNTALSSRPLLCRGTLCTLSRAPYGMPKTASSQNAIADCLPQVCPQHWPAPYADNHSDARPSSCSH